MIQQSQLNGAEDESGDSESEDPVFLDMEVELKLFGPPIKPDYVIMNRCTSKFLGANIPLFVVEVKRTQGKQSNLINDLDQHFK